MPVSIGSAILGQQLRSVIAPFALSACLLPLYGHCQEQLAPCPKLSRWSKEIVVCIEQVNGRLRTCPDGNKCYGRRVAGYQGQYRFYPIEINDIRQSRFRTTDVKFKVNGDDLMNGRWTVHTKDGRLLMEDVYENGYHRSAKTYDRRGRLREWLDYSVATEDEPYRCFVQKCTWLFGEETIWEGIGCVLDGNPQIYEANYVRSRE